MEGAVLERTVDDDLRMHGQDVEHLLAVSLPKS